MIEKLILFCIENKRFTSFLLFITTLLILIVTLIPPEQLGDSRIYVYDKPAHFLIFFGWTLLFGLFMFSRKRTDTKLIIVFLTGCMFGVFVEILQGVLPIGRNMDVYDAYTDIAGSMTAFFLLLYMRRNYISNEFEEQLNKIE